MKTIRVLLPLVLLCAACQPAQSPAPASTPAAARPVSTDAPDTSGAVPSLDNGTAASPPPAGVSAMAEAGDLVPGLPACAQGDGRTPIPVYMPRVDAQGAMSAPPPGSDGDTVLLSLQVPGSAQCVDSATTTFSFTAGATPGQLRVHGNTQEVDGVCHFNGLYTRGTGEPGKSGKDSPAIVTLDAADTSQIASSNRYCTQQAATAPATTAPPAG